MLLFKAACGPMGSTHVHRSGNHTWGYVQLDYGIQFAYSETREDGAVRVAVERPVDFGVYHVEPSACG